MRIGAAVAALSLVIVTPAFATPTTYTLDPAHSAATFSIKHLGISKFPTLSFKSTRVDTAAGGGLKRTGDLTIRGGDEVNITLDLELVKQ